MSRKVAWNGSIEPERRVVEREAEGDGQPQSERLADHRQEMAIGGLKDREPCAEGSQAAAGGPGQSGRRGGREPRRAPSWHGSALRWNATSSTTTAIAPAAVNAPATFKRSRRGPWVCCAGAGRTKR